MHFNQNHRFLTLARAPYLAKFVIIQVELELCVKPLARPHVSDRGRVARVGGRRAGAGRGIGLHLRRTAPRLPRHGGEAKAKAGLVSVLEELGQANRQASCESFERL